MTEIEYRHEFYVRDHESDGETRQSSDCVTTAWIDGREYGVCLSQPIYGDSDGHGDPMTMLARRTFGQLVLAQIIRNAGVLE